MIRDHSACWWFLRFVLIVQKKISVLPHKFGIQKVVFLHVKDFDVVVVWSSAQDLGIRREGQSSNGHGVAFERMQQFARLNIKDVHKTVNGTTGQIFSIGTLDLLKQNLNAYQQ